MSNPFTGAGQVDYLLQMNLLNARGQRPNILIGGDASTNPWQRGTSIVSPANGAITADRWQAAFTTSGTATISKGTTAPTVAQVASAIGYGRVIDSCFQVAVTATDLAIAAGDYFCLAQNIEGPSLYQWAQNVSHLSFWHAHNKAGTYCAGVRSGGADRSYLVEYTSDGTSTPTYVEFEIPASPPDGSWNYGSGAIGAQVTLTLMAGTTFQGTKNTWLTGNYLASPNQANGLDNVANIFRFMDVRLAPGPMSGGGIIVRDKAIERLICMRYLEKSFPLATAPANNAGVAGSMRFSQAVGAAAAQRAMQETFQVPKCKNPTITFYNPSAANALARNVTAAADVAGIATTDINEYGFSFDVTTAAGSAAGSDNAVHWLASAEP